MENFDGILNEKFEWIIGGNFDVKLDWIFLWKLNGYFDEKDRAMPFKWQWKHRSVCLRVCGVVMCCNVNVYLMDGVCPCDVVVLLEGSCV